MESKRVYLKNSDWLDISEEDYQWLDFTIEKTHATLDEAGKRFEKFFISYLGLLTLAAILTFSRSTASGPNEFKVPFLQLTVDRHYAAMLVIVLATCVLFSLVCTGVYEEVLKWRLEALVLVRYGGISTLGDVEESKFWYLLYPSLFRMSLFLKAYRASRFIPSVFLSLGILGLILPACLGWHIGTELSWSIGQRISLCIGLSILPVVSVILGVNIAPRSQAAAKIYTEMTDHFRKDSSQTT